MQKTLNKHKITKNQYHFGWDNTIAPVLTIAPGASVEFDLIDAGGGQVSPESSIEDVGRIDFEKVNPAFGPVYIDGAEPGDALKVTLLSLTTAGWGWTANIPGFGLLANRFQSPALHIWQLDPQGLEPAAYGPGGRVPLKPFPGIIGVAPAAAGIHSAVSPTRVGGNMDTRDLNAGAELLLPVEVPGALFSIGDGHAAQGDGEVCGTAIECPMRAAVKFELLKGEKLNFPRFLTSGPVSRHVDGRGFEATMGIGPDLMEAARHAVDAMVDLLAERHGMREVEAYMLCSVCADLRISEIVDVPHYVVSYYFPRVVFES